MNKKIIAIIIGLIIIVLILGGILYLRKPKPPITKCGDGICDEFERRKGICPQDCPPPVAKTCSQQDGTICSPTQKCVGSWLKAPDTDRCCRGKCQIITPPVIDYQDSPFGYLRARQLEKYVSDLGVKWIRLDAMWGLIQPTEDDVRNGRFDWQAIEDIWKYDQYTDKEVNFMIMISQLHVTQDSYIPNKGAYNEQSYLEFVKALIKRYSNDKLKNPIKHFQVENEPKPNIKDFAKLQKITYQAIKEECSDCKVLIGGIGYGYASNYIEEFDTYILPILEELNGRYIDIVDFHWFGLADEYRIKDNFEHIKNKLKINNFRDLPFWITEMGTYSGDPIKTGLPNVDPPYQSELQQAQSMIKRYVYSLSIGIDKIFWAWGIIEGFKNNRGWHDFTGLIYDDKFEHDKGEGVKKLSYYTYKKMVEVLEGSNWDNIQTTQEKGGIYIYKFIKQGKPIWVAWNDNPTKKQITISGLTSRQIKITEAIPDAESGAELDENDYPNFFNTETKTVSDGKVTITLGENPVFVEEK